MAENTLAVPSQIEPEIVAGLAALKKKGYRVKADEGAGGELALHFEFGANEQILKFSDNEWQKPGTVQKRIIDKLDI
ncbi:MAG: hypothetical protein JO051_10350 [Acidobacteriaceae bacterium]|nr:hypothetical protein [Acidobacteriaceae bacterium]